MSSPYLIQEVLGSVLEIAGTFLLAVEAIKLKNLHKLRQNVFGKPLKFLTTIKYKAPLDATEEKIAEIKEKLKNRAYMLLALVGFAVLVLIGALNHVSLNNWSSSVTLQLSQSIWVAVFVGFLVIVFTFAVSLVLGFLLYKVIYLPFDIPTKHWS